VIIRAGWVVRMRRVLPHVGLFLLIAAAYTLSGPGRIDMIDGQHRYDVTRNIIEQGKPVVTDMAIARWATPGLGGYRYFLGPSASVAALPFVGLGLALAPGTRALSQFLFSFTSGFLAAFACVLLFMTYELLGVTRRRAIAWTLVVAFATLLWPTSTSVFDQAQHAFAVMLAVYAGLRAGRGDSAGFAFLSGAAGGVLMNYQEVYVLLIPALGLTCMMEGERIWAFAKSRRFRAYVAGSTIGLAMLLLYNAVRFGSPLALAGSATGGANVYVNPLVGAAGLLFSPGKSLLLFSPPVLLAIFGWRHLYREHRTFARGVLLVIACHFLVIANLRFYGGDWCWGPRYLVVTLPLVCLALPFVTWPRAVKGAVIALGVVIQLLGIAVDHHRWFYENALADQFWADKSYYFTHSQLFARPGEVAEVYSDSSPIPDVRRFAPNPYRSPTYTTFGNLQRDQSPIWMKQFALFNVPRPWPLWMSRLSADQQPVAWKIWALLALLALAGGAAAIVRSWRLAAVGPDPASPPAS